MAIILLVADRMSIPRGGGRMEHDARHWRSLAISFEGKLCTCGFCFHRRLLKGTGADLPSEAIEAQTVWRQRLWIGCPGSSVAQQASVWEGQDARLDRMIGDALANVLMSADDGLRLLRSNPAPGDRGWREAMQGAALRTGDPVVIRSVWAESIRRRHSDPVRTNWCSACGQSIHGVCSGAEWLVWVPVARCTAGRGAKIHGPSDRPNDDRGGADARRRSSGVGEACVPLDRSPTGRGLLRCEQKMLLSDGWPAQCRRR